MKFWLVGAVVTCLVFGMVAGVYAAGQQYRIGPEDLLEISVWRDESLSREVIVPPDGIISFPLIGDINVNYLTVAQLRSKVTEKLSDFIPDATVTVILRQINSLKAYVIGKVIKPGEYPISLDTTVIQLLAKAGGLNPYATETKIHILRPIKDKTIRIPFDYREVTKGEHLEQNIILKRGDVIVVP
jgi:polysaccharide export outer membrane protein